MNHTYPRTIETLETVKVGGSTIVTADGRMHLALSAGETALLEQLDGTLSIDEVGDRFGAGGREIVKELDVAGMLVGSTAPNEPRVGLTSTGVEFAGFDRVVAMCNRLVGDLPGRPLLTRLSVLVAISGLVGILIRPPLDGSRFSAPVTLAALLALLLISGFVHETAHALVIHRNGRRVGRAGFGFYWGEISFFVDATDAYFLSKRQRLVQTLVGPATDAVTAGALGLASHVIGNGPWAMLLHQAAITGWLVALINAAPVLKLDGHWALADLLDTADLYGEMWDAVRRLRRKRRDRGSVALGLYAVASGLSGVALVASSAAAWSTHYGPLIADSWSSGLMGAVLAVGFVAPTATGAIAAAANGIRKVAVRVRGPIAAKEVSES